MFKFSLLLCFYFLSFSSYAQFFYMDTVTSRNKFDKILVLKQRGLQQTSSDLKFEKALIIYDSYSYYIDQSNKEVYFLASYIESPAVNGKINIRHYLEKYSIDKNAIVFENSFIITESASTQIRYLISNDGHIIKKGTDKTSKIELRKLSQFTKWWE